MKTITEVSKLTGLIKQRINDYEKAGLLQKPQNRNKYNYRLYDENDIARLWQIRFFKELGYTVPQMKKIFDNPNYDAATSIQQQIDALEEKNVKLKY